MSGARLVHATTEKIETYAPIFNGDVGDFIPLLRIVNGIDASFALPAHYQFYFNNISKPSRSSPSSWLDRLNI